MVIFILLNQIWKGKFYSICSFMFGEYEDLLERYTQAKSCGFQVISVSFSLFLLLLKILLINH